MLQAKMAPRLPGLPVAGRPDSPSTEGAVYVPQKTPTITYGEPGSDALTRLYNSFTGKGNTDLLSIKNLLNNLAAALETRAIDDRTEAVENAVARTKQAAAQAAAVIASDVARNKQAAIENAVAQTKQAAQAAIENAVAQTKQAAQVAAQAAAQAAAAAIKNAAAKNLYTAADRTKQAAAQAAAIKNAAIKNAAIKNAARRLTEEEYIPSMRMRQEPPMQLGPVYPMVLGASGPGMMPSPPSLISKSLHGLAPSPPLISKSLPAPSVFSKPLPSPRLFSGGRKRGVVSRRNRTKRTLTKRRK